MKRLAIAVLSIMSVLMLFSCDGNVSNPGTGPEEPTFIKPTEPAEVPEYDPSMGGEELSGAALDAVGTAFAFFQVDARLRIAVKLHFAGNARRSHTQVFQRTAESGLFMSFEMVHGDNNIGIGYG